VLVLSMRRRCLRVAHDLKLVWLQYPLQRIQEKTRIFRCPEVNIHCMQPVQVFALVHRVRRREVPLGRVLVGTGRLTAILAAEAINGQGEETRVLIRVLDPDSVQLWYHPGQLEYPTDWHVGDLRPAKASCSGVPAWFATSMRPLCRIGLW
jgi:hypothetical protein